MVNVVTIAAYKRIYWLRLIGLVQRSAVTCRCVLHSSNEPGELSQWQCHSDSAINIVLAITITIVDLSYCLLKSLLYNKSNAPQVSAVE